MTVFEMAPRAGGSFRYAGKAPLFQEVEAKEQSFERYIADMVAACEMKGAVFRYATDVTAQPGLLVPFDRIVIASGAEYRFSRFGFGALANWMLDNNVARTPGFARLFSSPALRDWFYYKARRATAGRFACLAQPGQTITVIGDAVRAGKSKQAIASAFEAALLRPITARALT